VAAFASSARPSAACEFAICAALANPLFVCPAAAMPPHVLFAGDDIVAVGAMPGLR
jgi:hypothetical protein